MAFKKNVDLAEIDHGFPTWIFLKESDSHNVSTLLVWRQPRITAI